MLIGLCSIYAFCQHRRLLDHIDYQSNDNRAKAGVFSIYATFVNNSNITIFHPFFEVKELKSLGADANFMTLLNADGEPGRLGSRINSNANGDHMLSPGESLTVLFEVVLESPDRFTLLVDLLGEIN